MAILTWRHEAVGGTDWGALVPRPGELLELHVFVDNSIVEVFANDRVVMTERVHPTSAGIRLSGDADEVQEFTTWPLQLDPIAQVAVGNSHQPTRPRIA